MMLFVFVLLPHILELNQEGGKLEGLRWGSIDGANAKIVCTVTTCFNSLIYAADSDSDNRTRAQDPPREA